MAISTGSCRTVLLVCTLVVPNIVWVHGENNIVDEPGLHPDVDKKIVAARFEGAFDCPMYKTPYVKMWVGEGFMTFYNTDARHVPDAPPIIKFLDKDGENVESEAVTQEEENILWEKRIMGPDDPKALRNALWYLFTKYLGFRGRQETRQLRWGDIKEKTDSRGKTFLEFTERNTKTRQGTTSDVRAFAPKMWRDEEHPVRCPIFLHREYARHRPAKMNSDDSPYFLSINYRRKPSSDTWYSCCPMGANELGRIMRLMAEEASLEGKKTNHSVRKTACTSLLHAGVPPTMVAQLSGHKAVSSLQHYAHASYDQQKSMFSILSGKRKASAALGAPPAETSQKKVTWEDEVEKSGENLDVPAVPTVLLPPSESENKKQVAEIEDDEDIPSSQTEKVVNLTPYDGENCCDQVMIDRGFVKADHKLRDIYPEITEQIIAARKANKDTGCSGNNRAKDSESKTADTNKVKDSDNVKTTDAYNLQNEL